MRKLPLADQLPYHFYPPRLNRFWLWAGRFYIRHLLRKQQRVVAMEFSGTEHLAPLLGRGDGVLIAPNHPDHADCGVVFELARRLGRPFYYMAAYQIFTGLNRVHLPRLGVFPVDREGSDLTAFKTGVEILAAGKNPLVVFPEGEIYFQADRLTPLREGAAVLAATAAKKVGDAGKTVWIVPAGIKYRFLDDHDPIPAFHHLLDDLEGRLTWRPRSGHPLVERIYVFAEGLLGLKELEYLGGARSGPLKPRLAELGEAILAGLEERRLGKILAEPVPVRVKELRRACLDALADPKTTPAEKDQLRHDLEDIFTVVQVFSYPGDYIRQCPTVERVAETLLKLEEDVRKSDVPCPHGPRRAVLRLGEPIDVREHLKAAGGKLRLVGPALTTALEARIQGLLDAIGPGRPLGDGEVVPAPVVEALQSSSAYASSSG